MFDLQALALQADLTRVWTFMMAREASSLTFPHLGIPMGHHEISHHNFEADKLEALAKIKKYLNDEKSVLILNCSFTVTVMFFIPRFSLKGRFTRA